MLHGWHIYQNIFIEFHIPSINCPFLPEVFSKCSLNSINMHSNWKHIDQNSHLQTQNKTLKTLFRCSSSTSSRLTPTSSPTRTGNAPGSTRWSSRSSSSSRSIHRRRKSTAPCSRNLNRKRSRSRLLTLPRASPSGKSFFHSKWNGCFLLVPRKNSY